MTSPQLLAEQIHLRFQEKILDYSIDLDELTLEISAAHLEEICMALRDETSFHFSMLIDICGVDYLSYGMAEWETERTTLTGYSRAVDVSGIEKVAWNKPRFAVVYHLLSLTHNHRVRLRTFPAEDPPVVDSVVDIWPCANWYEREVFDLFGILFNGHPDLRRILTDYGFIGHPFRKDFPLIGEVEMRYDATLQRCVYEPVSIKPRVLVPKVIRQDNRYIRPASTEEGSPNG